MRPLLSLLVLTACSRSPNPNAGAFYTLVDGELVRGEPGSDWQSALHAAVLDANHWCDVDAALACSGGACLPTTTFPFEHQLQGDGAWTERVAARIRSPATPDECQAIGRTLLETATFWDHPAAPGEIWCRGYLDPSAENPEPHANALCTRLRQASKSPTQKRLADSKDAEARAFED